MSHSRKAAFLGDSDFPNAVKSDKQGRQLKLYHEFYERYSSLDLSNRTDRPMAIAGLEKRLISALCSPGGYGIMHLNFPRDLLWQRQDQNRSLERVTFDHSSRVPSWSWMAFHGEIRYMNVPLGDVIWEERIISPFQLSDLATDTGYDTQHPHEFNAPISVLTREREPDTTIDRPRLLIQDDMTFSLQEPIKCIVVARGKRNLQLYAILVHLVKEEDGVQIFERSGVAYLTKNDIAVETSAEHPCIGRIQ